MPRLVFHPLAKRYLFLVAAMLLAATSFLLFIRSRATYLVVEIPATGKIVWAAPLRGDEQFQLRYIHSVDLLPVFEIYTSEGTQLVLAETRFLSWGAGLGYMQEGILCGDNGWTVIKEMKRRVGTIPLRVGTIAEHTLLYRGKEIRLRDYLPAQALVHIRVEENCFFKILRR